MMRDLSSLYLLLCSGSGYQCYVATIATNTAHNPSYKKLSSWIYELSFLPIQKNISEAWSRNVVQSINLVRFFLWFSSFQNEHCTNRICCRIFFEIRNNLSWLHTRKIFINRLNLDSLILNNIIKRSHKLGNMFLNIFLLAWPSEYNFSNMISLDQISNIIIGHCIIHHITNWIDNLRISNRRIRQSNIFCSSVNSKGMIHFHFF